MSDEQRVQSLVLELRALESYLNVIAAREDAVARAVVEGRAALDALKGLPENGVSEVLVPIGGGLYIRSEAPPPEKLVLNVGANVAVEKTRAEAVAYMDERLKELGKAFARIQSQKNDLVNRINSNRAEINSLVAKVQSGQG